VTAITAADLQPFVGELVTLSATGTVMATGPPA
jgi:hypothetical protein